MFVPFESMVLTLDSDGDGEISMQEWLDNLANLPGLKTAIDACLDPETGKIIGYQSLEDRLAVLLEKKTTAEAQLAKYNKQIDSIRSTVSESKQCDYCSLRSRNFEAPTTTTSLIANTSLSRSCRLAAPE